MAEAESLLPRTAADVRRLLKKAFPTPTYGVLYEVARGTGMNANRHLDAMVMSLWPSRGLDLTGVEIKVSRSDWRRELEQPQKAEELAQFCDFFCVAAPAGVVPFVEVPAKWGLYEFGKDGRLQITKAPARQEDKREPTKHLMAALFRAANRAADQDDIDAAVSGKMRELEATFEKRVEDRVTSRRSLESGDAKAWQDLKAIIKGDTKEWLADAQVMAAVIAVYRSGIASPYQGLASLQKSLRDALSKVDESMTHFAIDKKDLGL